MVRITGVNQEKIIICAYVILSVISSLVFNTKYISIVIGVIELTIVIVNIACKQTDKALLLFLFFLSTIIESSHFSLGVDDIKLYSIKTLPGIRTYHLFIISAILMMQSQLKKSKHEPQSNKTVYLFLVWILEIFVSVIVCFFLDDNGVASSKGLIRLVIKDCYTSLFTIGIIVASYSCMLRSEEFSRKLELTLICVLKGVVIAAIIIALIGNVRITEDGDRYLICPLILFWSPSLLLIYYQKRNLSYLFWGFISIVLQMKFTVGIPGAWWITTGMILFVFIIRTLKEVFPQTRVTIFQIASVLVLMGVVVFLSALISRVGNTSSNNTYIFYKLNTAISLFDFSNSAMAWLSSLGASIGIRIEQLVNIIIEFTKKPNLILLGKGFGGSIKHFWGIYNWSIASAYDNAQISAGVYSSLHTGIAELMINFGLIGVYLILCLIRFIITDTFSKRNNPWVIIGSLYLLIFYSYYWSMSLCIVIFAYGLYSRNSFLFEK